MSISEPVRQGEQNTDLELGEVMEILRARRRRVVLDALDREGEATFGDLVDYAAREIHGLGYSTTERKRLYVALYQNHLPKLDDYGVVSFVGSEEGEVPTGEDDRIRKGATFDDVSRILDAIRDAAEEEAVEAETPRPLTRTVAELLPGG